MATPENHPDLAGLPHVGPRVTPLTPSGVRPARREALGREASGSERVIMMDGPPA